MSLKLLRKWFVIAGFYVLLLKQVEMQELKDRYHQTDYKIKLEIVEIVNVNNTYVRNVTARLSWHNRTARVINGHGTLIKEIGQKARFEIQIYKFMSNEYRYFPIQVALTCVHTAHNTFGMKDFMTKYSNIPTGCNIKKGYYYMRNGIFDESQLPPYIPSGRYKFEAKLYNDHDYVGTLLVFLEVEEIKNWWK